MHVAKIQPSSSNFTEHAQSVIICVVAKMTRYGKVKFCPILIREKCEFSQFQRAVFDKKENTGWSKVQPPFPIVFENALVSFS